MSAVSVSLPRRQRGRQSREAEVRYDADVRAFAERILQIDSTLDFHVSSRGWGYILEGRGEITKGELDAAERLINDCRKNGTLPLDICSEDDRRAADGIERIDADIDDEIEAWRDTLLDVARRYSPFSFWDGQEFYVEMAVEKGDLKNLFAPICQEFYIPRQSIGGWSDLHCRAAMMRRFAKHELAGRKPVLLYCGDHDPGGLKISDCLRSNLEELADAAGWHPHNLIIDRFGLNLDDIERLGLLWIDNLITGSGKNLADPKHPQFADTQKYIAKYGARKCEANALVVRPAEGRELCRQAVERYISPAAPFEYERRLQIGRAELRQAMTDRFRLESGR
jgi:hypothetical protein